MNDRERLAKDYPLHLLYACVSHWLWCERELHITPNPTDQQRETTFEAHTLVSGAVEPLIEEFPKLVRKVWVVLDSHAFYAGAELLQQIEDERGQLAFGRRSGSADEDDEDDEDDEEEAEELSHLIKGDVALALYRFLFERFGRFVDFEDLRHEGIFTSDSIEDTGIQSRAKSVSRLLAGVDPITQTIEVNARRARLTLLK